MVNRIKKQTDHSKYINHILASSVFKSTKLYSNLLAFLFDKHQEGVAPKESTIAIEFFKKDINFNTNEHSIVRFHMHKLRKKLEAYYQTEGKTDALKVSIPKGHYELLFEQTRIRRIDRLTALEKGLGLLCAICVLITLILLFRPSTSIKQPISEHDPFWSSFFENQLPNQIVIGDFFVFEEWDGAINSWHRVMDYTVTSEADFEDFQEKYPQKIVRPLALGELPHNSIFNLKSLNHVFYSLNRDYDLKMTKDLTHKDFKGRNSIYVGAIRHLRNINEILDHASIHFTHQVHPQRKLMVFDTKGDTVISFCGENLWTSDSLITDYGMIAKFPGFRNEKVLLICGFAYISQIELVNLICYPENLKLFYDEMQRYRGKNQVPDYFIAIFKVEGYAYTSIRSSMQYFKVLE